MTGSPRGLLLDYGGTLVEEVAYDTRAGAELLPARAERPPAASLDAVLERADRITRDVADRRDLSGIETPWPSRTRLINDFFGTRFAEPLDTLQSCRARRAERRRSGGAELGCARDEIPGVGRR